MSQWHIPKLPPKELRHRIRHSIKANFETGILVWKNPLARCLKPGDVAGFKRKDGYIQIGINCNGVEYDILAHHIIWYLYYGKWPKRELDHQDTIKWHNWIDNLRLAKNHSQQMANTGMLKNNTSGVKGLYYRKDISKWSARIQYKNKDYSLGTFKTKKEAKYARQQAEKELFGKWRYKH